MNLNYNNQYRTGDAFIKLSIIDLSNLYLTTSKYISSLKNIKELNLNYNLLNIWNKDSNLIKGRKMTFRYYDLTDDGIPKFANVTGFRDDDL